MIFLQKSTSLSLSSSSSVSFYCRTTNANTQGQMRKERLKCISVADAFFFPVVGRVLIRTMGDGF